MMHHGWPAVACCEVGQATVRGDHGTGRAHVHGTVGGRFESDEFQPGPGPGDSPNAMATHGNVQVTGCKAKKVRKNVGVEYGDHHDVGCFWHVLGQVGTAVWMSNHL